MESLGTYVARAFFLCTCMVFESRSPCFAPVAACPDEYFFNGKAEFSLID